MNWHLAQIMHVSLFGGLRLQIDGEPFHLRMPRSTAELFSYLLLNCRAAQHRQSVAFAVWPDDSENEASAKLRRHLYNIRKALPPIGGSWFLVTETTVQWNYRSGVSLDVDRFERLAAEPQTIAAACELYTADLLPDFEAEWLLLLRQRYRDRFIDLSARLLAQAEGRRDFAAMLRHSKHVLRIDPYREDVLRKVMLARFRTGDRAGALQEYDRFESLLRRELYTGPMPETDALRKCILDAGEQPDGPVHAASHYTLHFVGRRNELSLLGRAFDESLRGERNTVIVTGETGAGKSRLIEKFCEGVAGSAASTFCQADGAVYQPLVELLTACAGHLRRTGLNTRWLQILGSFVPELREETLPEEHGNCASGHGTWLDAVSEALLALSALQPRVFVIEDIHVASGATLAAFAQLRLQLAGAPVLFLFTYRQDAEINLELTKFLKATRKTGALIIDVPRLTKSDVAHLFEQRTPGLAYLAGSVFDATGGNALFVTQMLEHCIESGGQPGEVRGSVSTAIDRRLDKLPEDALLLAEGASVIGDFFDVETLRDVTRWERSRLFDALSMLLDHHMIHERKSSRSLGYAFSHRLVRERLYYRLLPEARAARHSRIARVLEAYDSAVTFHALEIAQHFERAGEPQRSAVYYLHAARSALDFGAGAEAADLAARGLHFLGGPWGGSGDERPAEPLRHPSERIGWQPAQNNPSHRLEAVQPQFV